MKQKMKTIFNYKLQNKLYYMPNMQHKALAYNELYKHLIYNPKPLLIFSCTNKTFQINENDFSMMSCRIKTNFIFNVIT